jgi:hypothetical protein
MCSYITGIMGLKIIQVTIQSRFHLLVHDLMFCRKVSAVVFQNWFMGKAACAGNCLA